MNTFEETLRRFRETVSGPPDEIPLARAALYVARTEYPDIDIDGYERRLQDMATTLEQRLHRDEESRTPLRVLNTVNQLLYRELGFRGNADHYNDPRNLYLSDVLSERTGIPVTLAIVYIEVCQRAGLDVRAVGLPGHVVCRLEQPGVAPAAGTGLEDGEPLDDGLYIDVFNRGRPLSVRDCQVLVRNVFGNKIAFKPHYLAALTSRQVLQRLLHNLKAGYLQRGDEDRAARIIDLLLVLFPWDLDEIRDRGMLRERLGEYQTALNDLEQYVQYRPGARDIHTVSETVRSLRRHAEHDADDN